MICTVFYKKLVCKKLLLSFSKSEESSVLDFWDLKKSFGVYLLKISIYLCTSVMYVMLDKL